MEKHSMVDSILEGVKLEVVEFLAIESKITLAIEYEQWAMDIALKFAMELIQKSTGKLPKTRNDKRNCNTVWKVRITKEAYYVFRYLKSFASVKVYKPVYVYSVNQWCTKKRVSCLKN